MNCEKLLWVKANAFMKQEQMDALRESIKKQAEEGVVVLPSYCEPVIMTDEDLEVMVEQNGFI